jgi:hypothetical protein
VIPPKSQVTVWLGEVPSSYVVVVQYVGNTYPLGFDVNGNPAVTLRWMIDGDLVEDVQRIIANPNAPRQLDPAYMATQELRVLGINNHPTQSALASFLMDGFMRRRTDT